MMLQRLEFIGKGPFVGTQHGKRADKKSYGACTWSNPFLATPPFHDKVTVHISEARVFRHTSHVIRWLHNWLALSCGFSRPGIASDPLWLGVGCVAGMTNTELNFHECLLFLSVFGRNTKSIPRLSIACCQIARQGISLVSL